MAESPQRFQVGRWQVEPDAGSMSDGRETVQVPPRLMRLLQLLIVDAGNTVSRESLIEALWPRGYVNEEALSRAVNELRRLLGDDARTPEFILTVPKKGYRLIAGVGPVSEKKKPPLHLIGLFLIGPIFMILVLGLLLWITAKKTSACRCAVRRPTPDSRSRPGVAPRNFIKRPMGCPGRGARRAGRHPALSYSRSGTKTGNIASRRTVFARVFTRCQPVGDTVRAWGVLPDFALAGLR